MNDTSGLTSGKPFAFYDPESQSLRTWLDTDQKDSTAYSQTVPKTGSMSGGYLYEHPTPELPIGENGCFSLYPTPTAADGRLPGGNRKSPSLARVEKFFPTPRTTDCNGGGQHGEGGQDLRTAVTALADSGCVGFERRGSAPVEAEGSHSSATGSGASAHNTDIDWGEYEPAIRRWEILMGRPAPNPTEPNRNGKPRLAALFDEWLMGLKEGWVTDSDIPYGAQIKLMGNGVVIQQARAAIRYLIGGVKA